MPVQYVSLINKNKQKVEVGRYTTLSFVEESSDKWNMHTSDSRLILPSQAGIGLLELNVMWDAGDYEELRDVFIRDPFAVSKNKADHRNLTGYDHRAPSPGMQCFTKQHSLLVEPGVPLAVQVYHDATHPVNVIHAQFKLTIWS